MAELKDENYNELLFKQPDSSHLGDCPICFLPMSVLEGSYVFTTCCCKLLCNRCAIANKKREKEEKLEHRCPFCREPLAGAGVLERVKNRAKRNDPVAMCELGKHFRADGDYMSAFDCFSRAAAMGDMESHNELGVLYHFGYGVERNESNAVFNLEKAAIGGNPNARWNLANIEWENGQYERAVKHWIIAAKQGGKQGENGSLERLKTAYKRGLVSKDDFAAALRGHQAAVDATKSPHR